MYRVLEQNQEVLERRKVVRKTHHQKPELLATAPNQVWSWDITKLLGPVKWSYFYLYVLLDIFSRYVVGWMVAERQTAALGKDLIAESCRKQDISPDQLTIHSDRGPQMKSKLLVNLYADLGLTRSLNRPYVSNDNPFSESQFKTTKHHPGYPGRFGCVQDARGYFLDFVPWYNDEHYHSGIGFFTPRQVHYGLAGQIYVQRQRTLETAFAAHPERFVHGLPKPMQVPTAVWINPPPNQKTPQQGTPTGPETSDQSRTSYLNECFSAVTRQEIKFSGEVPSLA